jgi:hypothetical protein
MSLCLDVTKRRQTLKVMMEAIFHFEIEFHLKMQISFRREKRQRKEMKQKIFIILFWNSLLKIFYSKMFFYNNNRMI